LSEDNTRKIAYVNQYILLPQFSLLISTGLSQYNAAAYVLCLFFLKFYLNFQIPFLEIIQDSFNHRVKVKN